MAQSISSLVQNDSQKRLFQLQVWRSPNWVTIPVESAKASIGKGKSGKIDVAIVADQKDLARAQMYEGEFVRAFSTVEGAPPVRRWTGYVDFREPSDQASGLSRKVTVTDMIQELNTSILLDGVVYDNLAPNAAVADLVSRAITSQQYKLMDDSGNAQTSLANYNSANGNSLLYAPDLANDDGSTFYLPQGTVASFTGSNGTLASFTIPVASGTSYSTFELPKRFVIASTCSMPGFTIASTSQTFPPAVGTTILDSYNGIFYFNPSQASTTVSFTASYYDAPLFNYAPGKKVGDIISEIMDKTGQRWYVDGAGKINCKSIDVIRAPKRILNKGQYINNGIEINRDRRNVIVILGWDGNCGGILASKAVNIDDINNAPPSGLGKRQYMIAQDKAWKTQYAVNKAAFYAVQQVGRRGKIAAIQIIDDPSLNLEDVLCFEGTVSELAPSDFFYIEQINWNYSNQNGNMDATASITGTMIPGRGTIYLGPITGTTSAGMLDYSQDVQPFTNAHLTPAGGTYYSTFSIASGLNLVYTVGGTAGKESIDLYGSDGSHIVIESNIARGASQVLNLPLPMGGLTPGVMYVVKLWFKDNNGNIGCYRDFILARA